MHYSLEILLLALDALLHTTELSSGHANDLIQGLIRLYPALAHGVLSTCLKSQIHANLLLQLVCRQPPASFLALFDSIHRRQGRVRQEFFKKITHR